MIERCLLQILYMKSISMRTSKVRENFQLRPSESEGNKATLHPPSELQVRVKCSRQGSGSLLSRVSNSCISRTVTYEASVSANCSRGSASKWVSY